VIVPIYVPWHLDLCQEIANMSNKSAAYVLIFVMLVLKNVKSIDKWTIVKNVLKHVVDVLKNVKVWPNEKREKKNIHS
jgi:hypothetical protein